MDQVHSPHLLVVDDDPDIRELVVAHLTREGYRLSEAADLSAVRAALENDPPDLVVLDLNLPDGDGLALSRELRSAGQEVPIIMVTARDSAIDRVLGLELGADDYLTKPFEPRELSARIRNLLRRHSPTGVRGRGHHYAHFDTWRLDLLRRRLIAADNRLVMLSTTEYDILLRLVDNPGRALSREELLPARAATAAFDRTIDNQISRLRQKLGGGLDGEIILTVRNQGYMLAGSVRYS